MPQDVTWTDGRPPDSLASGSTDQAPALPVPAAVDGKHVAFTPTDGLTGTPRGEDDESPRTDTGHRALTGGDTVGYFSATGSTLPAPTVPGYEILGELGRGGMGVVYKARHTKLNRLVALKMILSGEHAGAAEVDRFRREAEAIAHLQHPGIIQIHEIGDHDGRPYLSLEFADGGSLQQQLAGTPQPVARAAQLTATLARAMAYAHQHGVVHRDLKPGNVLFAEGLPKITDFGLAKRLEGNDSVTRSGSILGTPSYMAPEQASGDVHATGPATDVYSLGAIMYEMLTGRPPFRAASTLETIRQVVSEDPVPPRRLQPRVPVDLETICLKCLRKETGQRFGSATALADDLDRFLGGQPIQARPASMWEKAWKWAKRRPAVAALTLLSLVLTAVGFGLVTWQWLEADGARRQAERAEQAKEVERVGAVAAREEAVGARQVEHAQRKQAEEERRKAEVERQKAEEERKRAEAERRKFQQLSARLLLEKGQNLCEQDDVGRGVLWLARGLETATADDVDLQRVFRTGLADWSRRLHPLRLAVGHKAPVSAIAFRPDGKTFVTASADRTAQLWEADNGKPLGTLMRHKAEIDAAVFSSDSKILMTGSRDRTARLWNAETGEPLGKPLQHDAQVRMIAISPDNKLALTAGLDNRVVRLWDVATGMPAGEPLKHEADLRCVAVSPDSKLVVTGAVDRKARVWNVADGKLLAETAVLPLQVILVAFSPRGDVFATASGRDVQFWETASGKPVGEVMKHLRGVSVMSFAGSVLRTGAGDGVVRLWRVPSGAPLNSFTRHAGGISALTSNPGTARYLTASHDQTARLALIANYIPCGAPLPHISRVQDALFSPDGKAVLTRTDERLGRLWDVSDDRIFLRRFSGEGHAGGGSIYRLAISPDGKTLLTGNSADRIALLRDAATAKSLRGLVGHEGNVVAVAFSPDGKKALTGAADQTARLWDVETGKQIGEPLLHDSGTVLAVEFSRDGKRVLTAGNDSTARLWDVETGKSLAVVRHKAAVLTARFSPDGKWLLTGSSDRTARLWDAATGEPLGAPLDTGGAVRATAFSPDGKTIVTADSEGIAQLWDAATGKAQGEPMRHLSNIRAAVFSPDGKTVATASDDGSARVWDAQTGKPLAPPLLHNRTVHFVMFSPDSRTVMTGGEDSAARFWDTATGIPLGAPLLGNNRLGIFSAGGVVLDGKSVVAMGSIDGVGLVADRPTALSGSPARLTCWLETITGLELSADGVVGALDADQWQERRKRLAELGGPPTP